MVSSDAELGTAAAPASGSAESRAGAIGGVERPESTRTTGGRGGVFDLKSIEGRIATAIMRTTASITRRSIEKRGSGG